MSHNHFIDETMSTREKTVNGYDRVVKQCAPILTIETRLKSLGQLLLRRERLLERLRQYEVAATALDEIIQLGALAETQVDHLVSSLSDAMLAWKEKLYTPSFKDAPRAARANVKPDGRMDIEVEREGTCAPAQHVSNASDLRATLLSFLLAFRDHLLQTQGGISILLLDDLQELFDPSNRRRIARAIPEQLKHDARIVFTTNDESFGNQVISFAKESIKSSEIAFWHLHTLNGNRTCIELGSFVGRLEEKRSHFENPENENNNAAASDYLNALRIFIENRLLDLFDVRSPQLPEKPMLSDLVSAIRTRINAGSEVFSARVFQDLINCPSLRSKSPLMELLNESHHGNSHLITYNAVFQLKDACRHLFTLVNQCHDEYELWLRRDQAPIPTALPSPPAELELPSFTFPVFKSVAAFTLNDLIGMAEPALEAVVRESFGRCAMYAVNTDNLGFAASRWSRVLVDIDSEEVVDSRLVIALFRDKILARRLLRDRDDKSSIALGAEASNPLRRPPSLILKTQEVRLLKVIGVFFDQDPVWPKPNGEAIQVNEARRFSQAQIAFKVSGESALPLALPGQIILGGTAIAPSELGNNLNKLVAVSTEEDGDVFKRVGKSVSGFPNVIQLESIGGAGASMTVRSFERDNDPCLKLPLVTAVREIIGVLYELPNNVVNVGTES